MALLRPERPFKTEHTQETGFLAAIRKRGWNGSEAKPAKAKHESEPASDREKLLATLRSRVSGHTEENYDPYETTGELERREKVLSSDPAGLGAVMKERIGSIPKRAQELAAKQAEPAPPVTPRIASQAGRMAGAMREHLASEQERVKKAGFDRRLDIGIREYEERTKPEREKRLQEEREELEAIMSAPSGPRRELAVDEPSLAERTTDRDFYEQQRAKKVEPDQDEITTEEMTQRIGQASPTHKPRGARRRELETRIEMHQALNARADKLDTLAQEMRTAADWSPAEQEEVLKIMDEFLQRVARNKKLKGQ